MTGLIGIAHVLGGDFLAINPADIEVEGELPVYFCGHDPFGYGMKGIIS